MDSKIKISGQIKLKLYGPDGKLKESRQIQNTIVTAGKNFLATWLAQATQALPFMNYIQLGTGTTAPLITDTDLETPLTPRVIGTLTDISNVWQNEVTFGAGIATGAITEAGVFSALTAGTMFARQVFGVVNKGAGDSLDVTWQVTFS